MKRDWDLIRKQLTDVEAENDLFSDAPKQPEWRDQTEADYKAEFDAFLTKHRRIFGHFELLIDGAYIEGISLLKTTDGCYHINGYDAKLTMSGHDLLDTIRSKGVWEKIKSTASEKGIELTFDAVKALGAFTLKNLLE